MSMKEKKKVYVKPAITMTEWVCGEDLCTVYEHSPCITIRDPTSTASRKNHIQINAGDQITWEKWGSGVGVNE